LGSKSCSAGYEIISTEVLHGVRVLFSYLFPLIEEGVALQKFMAFMLYEKLVI
jgi:hypothetical protein